jgi:hypothetical protein
MATIFPHDYAPFLEDAKSSAFLFLPPTRQASARSPNPNRKASQLSCRQLEETDEPSPNGRAMRTDSDIFPETRRFRWKRNDASRHGVGAPESD